jgi:NAD(P)-dependent dehydrogenase (short-subunit alcohol dehydrogenase family)
MMANHNNHVLVVGGTKGLGRLVTERCLERGDSVTVLSRNAPDTLLNHPQLHHVAVNLEALTDTDQLVADVTAHFGPIRYMIFCQRYRGTDDQWAGEIQVTLTSTDKLIKSFIDNFCQDGDKAIAVVSSVYANFVGNSQPVGYHVAKAGLNQLVKYYAWELGQKGVRINSIMPLTYLKNESREFYNSQPDLMALYGAFVPLKRMGDANDSANLIDFLCSDKASFITGQSIFVDGGTSVMWPEQIAKSLTGN